MPTAELEILSTTGPDKRRIALAGKRTYYIGRAPDNDVRIADAAVSRRHAMIQMEANGVHNIIDLGSANGTLVNDRRIVTPHRLATGDRITIGTTILLFRQLAPVERPAALADLDADDQTVAAFNTVRVTVLVSDIDDFTPLAEAIGATRAGHLLREWSSRVERIVADLGGTVDKFLGDGVLAWWPEQERPAEPVRRALQAAHAIATMTASLKLPGIEHPLATAAAINTGEAVAGSIAGRQRFTVIGDAVNVAFRLEEATDATPHDILIGEDAGRLLGAAPPWFTACTCNLKGKAAPVRAFGITFSQAAAFLASQRRKKSGI